MEEVVKYLIEFKFSQKTILEILGLTIIYEIPEDKLLPRITENFNWLKDNGYYSNDIKKIVKNYPLLCWHDLEYLQKRKSFLENLGYSKVGVNKILKSVPKIMGYSTENILEKINYFIKLGFTKEEFIKKSIIYPQILEVSKNMLISKQKLFLDLGYTLPEYKQIINPFLAVFSLDDKEIVSKFNCLINLGFSKEDVISLTVKCPILFSYKEEIIQKKITFLKSINLGSMILRLAPYLVMSTEILAARYNYLQSIGVNLTYKNYLTLFSSNKEFREQFGISNEELLAKYSDEDEEIKRK